MTRQAKGHSAAAATGDPGERRAEMPRWDILDGNARRRYTTRLDGSGSTLDAPLADPLRAQVIAAMSRPAG